jgi:hypothetical protein
LKVIVTDEEWFDVLYFKIKKWWWRFKNR